MFTKEQLAQWREQDFVFDDFYDDAAMLEAKKELEIKYTSSKTEDALYLITVSVYHKYLKSRNGFVNLIDAVTQNTIATIPLQLNDTNFSIQLKFPKHDLLSTVEKVKVVLYCDGMQVETSVFNVSGVNKANIPKEYIPEKCFCKKTFWTADDLRYIVTQLRKLDTRIIKRNPLDYRGNRTYLDKHGQVLSSTDRGKEPKESVGLNIILEELPFYDEKASDKEQIKDRLFYINLGEKLDGKDANYECFSKIINPIFTKYKIDTCIRKLHFLTQVYVETLRFTTTYESDESAKKAGEDFYRGRGFIHITHDYGYRQFYKALNSKEPTDNELKEFVPKVASKLEYAIRSAAWYWEKNDINQYADKDDIERVSAAVNFPRLLQEKTFSPDGIRMIADRKKIYEFMKIIFNYENCK